MDRHDPYAGPEILDTYSVASAHAVMTGDLPTALAIARAMTKDELLRGHSLLCASSLIPPLALTGDFDEALRYADIAWHGWHSAGRPAAGWLAPPLAAAALVRALTGDHPGYRTWRARIPEVAGVPERRQFMIAPLAFADARVAIHTHSLGNAASLVAQAPADYPGARYSGYAKAAAAELAVVAADLPNASDLLQAAEAAASRNQWASACVSRARGRLDNNDAALRDSVRRWERISARFERACTFAAPARSNRRRA
jgi:hypothetical protein